MEHEKIEYAAWVGIDWGSEKHAICLQIEGSDRLESCELEQKAEDQEGQGAGEIRGFLISEANNQ